MAQPAPQTASDSQLLNLKVPPHSIDAEQSVLGGLLIDNGAFDKIGDVVTDGDFYRDDHRRIFRHVSRLIERGKPADVVTVDEAIKVSEDKDKTGGITYLAALAGNTPSAHNVRRYAEIVRECAVLRKLIEVSTEIADSALNRMGKDVGQLLDEAESKIFQIAEAGARTRQGFMEIQPLLTQVMERIDLLYHKDNPSDITGIPTGYRDLDRETSGLQPGDLIIIAGRPSMGKTALALNMAEHAAVENKLPVAIFSMEMSGSQLAMRMLGSIGRLDQHKLRTGRLSDDDWNRLTNAVGKLHDAPILVDESGALNALELRARAAAAPPVRHARADRGRLPPAHAGVERRREPGHRDFRDFALAQIARQGAQSSRGGAVAAFTRGRAAHRPEAPDHVGPARVRSDRAGRRPDPRNLPRGGLYARHARKGRR